MVASESLARVALGPVDVAGALALSDAAGWNQTADDWALFIGHGRSLGCRSDSGELVATAAALPYGGAQGWISMVLVAQGWRHRGLATELMGDCVASLRSAGLTPVLDATPAGAQVYQRMGFAPGLEFERWEADSTAARAAQAGEARRDAPRPAGADDLAAMVALDAAASRVDRRFLIEAFMARGDSRAWMTPDGSGFVMARAGRRATQIGPLVAADAPAAIVLLDAALARPTGQVFLDVPRRWAALTEWLQQRGFRRQRPFVRMALGEAAALSGSEWLFVVAGPEFG